MLLPPADIEKKQTKVFIVHGIFTDLLVTSTIDEYCSFQAILPVYVWSALAGLIAASSRLICLAFPSQLPVPIRMPFPRVYYKILKSLQIP